MLASALTHPSRSPSPRLPVVPAVASFEAISKRYGSATALDAVSLELYPGEVLAMLGPNGAGKTTAIRILLGLSDPSEGTVSIFGDDPRRPRARMRMGVMLQVARVPETLRVREHIDLFRSYYPAPLPFADVIRTAHLEGLEERMFGKLSGGERQRVLFALAICGNPDLIFLDEPTTGMDIETRRCLWDEVRRLREAGKTVLLTTHYLEEADALATRVVVLAKGRIVAAGTPAQIKAIVSGKRIRCVTSLQPAAVGKLPGVLNIKADGEAVVITTHRAEQVARELLLRDPTLRDLEISSAGLEEAFLALTSDQQESSSPRREMR